MCQISLNIRLPDSPTSWMGQMTAGTWVLENLVTVKLERCCNMWIWILLTTGVAVRRSKTSACEEACWNSEIVMGLSWSTGDNWGFGPFWDGYWVLVHNWVLKYVECTVTHLYIKKCAMIPSCLFGHLKINLVSLANLWSNPDPVKWSDQKGREKLTGKCIHFLTL